MPPRAWLTGTRRTSTNMHRPSKVGILPTHLTLPLPLSARAPSIRQSKALSLLATVSSSSPRHARLETSVVVSPRPLAPASPGNHAALSRGLGLRAPWGSINPFTPSRLKLASVWNVRYPNRQRMQESCEEERGAVEGRRKEDRRQKQDCIGGGSYNA